MPSLTLNYVQPIEHWVWMLRIETEERIEISNEYLYISCLCKKKETDIRIYSKNDLLEQFKQRENLNEIYI